MRYSLFLSSFILACVSIFIIFFKEFLCIVLLSSSILQAYIPSSVLRISNVMLSRPSFPGWQRLSVCFDGQRSMENDSFLENILWKRTHFDLLSNVCLFAILKIRWKYFLVFRALKKSIKFLIMSIGHIVYEAPYWFWWWHFPLAWKHEDGPLLPKYGHRVIL